MAQDHPRSVAALVELLTPEARERIAARLWGGPSLGDASKTPPTMKPDPAPVAPDLRAEPSQAATRPYLRALPGHGPRGDLVTRKSASQLLNMDPRTFDRRLRPHVTDHGLGGSPRFSRAEILAFVAHGGSSAPPSFPHPSPSPSLPVRHLRVRNIRRHRLVRAKIVALRRLARAIHAYSRSISDMTMLADEARDFASQSRERESEIGSDPSPR